MWSIIGFAISSILFLAVIAYQVSLHRRVSAVSSVEAKAQHGGNTSGKCSTRQVRALKGQGPRPLQRVNRSQRVGISVEGSSHQGIGRHLAIVSAYQPRHPRGCDQPVVRTSVNTL